MHKVRRRRVVPVDVHSEDEDEFDVTREELELSDLSGSEASCEDSDIESENSHSDGEEEIGKETEELADSLTDEESDRLDDPDLAEDKNGNKPRVLTGWQKKLLARQEYRKKLAEDPAFVPHLGEFWGHDDRFIRDELKNDFDRRPRNLPFAPKGRVVWGVNEPRGRWDHDGFEELMKMEEEERRRKEFQRRFQQRRGFRPRIYRHRPIIRNNIPSFKINQNRMSNLSAGRKPLPSRIVTTNSKVQKSLNNIGTSPQRTYIKENRTDFKQKGVETTVESTPQYNNQKHTSHSRDTNRFRGGRGYSKTPLRTQSSRVHSVYHKQSTNVNGKNTIANKKSADVNNEQGHLKPQNEGNGDDIDKDHKLTKEEPGPEAVTDPPSRKTSITQENDGHVNLQTSNSTESNGATMKSEDRSENSQSPSSKESPTSPLTEDQEKERAQTTQSSKRYSTRRVATTPATQATEQEVAGSGVGPSRVTGEIPPSAVYAPPFRPRSMTLSEDKEVKVEEENLLPQQPLDTPIRYYTPNRVPMMPSRSNNLMENNSGIAVSPTQFESNGMVYYYDPNVYQPYYYYPSVETKDGNDKAPYMPQPPVSNAVLDNGVYYYYPVYYQ